MRDDASEAARRGCGGARRRAAVAARILLLPLRAFVLRADARVDGLDRFPERARRAAHGRARGPGDRVLLNSLPVRILML